MQECPCGYYGDPSHECTCSQASIERYLNKVSGPLLDRIDLHVEVSPVKFEDLNNTDCVEESSSTIRKRVNIAREMQNARYKNENIYSNSQLSAKLIAKYCRVDNDGKRLLESAFNNLGFSARAYNKILKVARTIADLDGKDIIQYDHIAEAVQYRNLDRKFWR